MIVTFIPAAGRSSRMGGRDKLLETIGGVPILRRTAEVAIGAGLGPVIVGVRSGDRVRPKSLSDLDLRIIEVPDAEEGMAATLRAGARAALAVIADDDTSGDGTPHSGMIVLLPDMPELEAGDLVRMESVFQARGGPVVRATTQDATPGHPVLFPAYLLRDFGGLAGDRGAMSLLEDAGVVDVPLQGERARLDLDTPEDWAAWRDTSGNRQ